MVVNINGGLGNQMFQYAFGYAYSRQHNEKLKMDVFYLGLDKQRQLGINKYNLTYTQVGRLRGAIYYSIRKLIKNGLRLRSWNRISKTVGEISPYDYQYINGKNLFAIGVWMNTRYFEDYREELLQEYTYKRKITKEQRLLIKKIASENSLAIHVRRGDYLKPENDVYHNMSKTYYMNAINYLKDKYDISTIYFFSDDIPWCKSEYSELEEAVFVDDRLSGNPYIDMELMRNCKYFITANSTFGWWGAWLSTRKYKVMIAPRIWFNGKENEIYNVRVRSALLKDFLLIDE